MHMALAHRLIDHLSTDLTSDSALPGAARHTGRNTVRDTVRDILQGAWGAFLLGSIAPDARVSSGMTRGSTHFFEYAPTIPIPPAVNLLQQYPELRFDALRHTDMERAAFVCGYCAHLSMDEIWCTHLLFPHFQTGWGTGQQRFHMLHMLLSALDERDYTKLPESDYTALAGCVPRGWLPFMPDADLTTWRELIAHQMAPVGHNQTFEILGMRIGLNETQMAEFIHDEQRMTENLWVHISPSLLAEVEQTMYEAVFTTVFTYLNAV
jgi:hypothetical protein